VVPQAALRDVDRLRLLTIVTPTDVPGRKCHDLVGLLADFVEHQLPPGVHQSLERHLAACPRCVAQLKTYESTVSLLHSIKDEDLPPELRCTLKAFLDRNCGN
jgi:anti-sigma factor RsiW